MLLRPGFSPDALRSRGRLSIAIALAATVLVTGCTETSSTVSTNPDAVTTSKCQVSLSAPGSMAPDGGNGSVAVTTQPECAWTASSTVNWITALTPASGQGSGNVAFRVLVNDTAGAREGDIVINEGRAHVSQRAPCRYDVAPANQNVDPAGGSGSLTVTTAADCAWSASADVPWITFPSAANGTGSGTVAFSVAGNTGPDRVGTIAINGQRATISQPAIPAPNCSATITPTSQDIAAAGGAGTAITVTTPSTCRWTTVSSVPWITVVTGANGLGNGSVTYTVAANTGAARSGTLTIAGRVFTVNQAAAAAPPPPPPPACTYSISPGSQNIGVAGGTGNVSVTTTSACAWTATSNAAWIAVTAGASGTGNGTVSYLVSPNTGAARSGTIAIGGQTFTVNQAALSCSFTVAPNNFNIAPAGGTGTVAVTTAAGCSWTAASNDAWISITSGASGTGSGTVTFNVAANTGRDRKGDLTVAGRNVSVDQKGP